MKAAFFAIFDHIEAPPGEAAIAVARERAEALAKRYGSYTRLQSCE